jgi:hypothetical protein
MLSSSGVEWNPGKEHESNGGGSSDSDHEYNDPHTPLSAAASVTFYVAFKPLLDVSSRTVFLKM